MSDIPQTSPPQNAWFDWLGVALSGCWACLSALTSDTQTWSEALNSAAVALGAILVILLGRGPARLSATAGGRIALVGIFIAGLFALNPALHLNTASRGGALALMAAAVCGSFWLFSFGLQRTQSTGAVGTAARLEEFLASSSARRNMLLLAGFAVIAGILISGYSLRNLAAPLLFVLALVLALRALLAFAHATCGARALAWAPVLACAIAAAQGISAYLAIERDVNEVALALKEVRHPDAWKAYNRVVAESNRMHTIQPRIEQDTLMAQDYERVKDQIGAAKHWTEVAILLNVSGEQFPPLQRVQCAQGDSLLAWRRLVFEGFNAVNTPDLAPGIQRLGEVATDVRGKLLAALLAWERKEPEDVRKSLLQDAQRLSPGEPTSYGLLKRMGETLPPLKDNALWLPPQLILGPRPSKSSADGLIEELGETGTVVYLEEGHWELTLRAVGTPLHEEWPVVRVELGGQILGPTQVNKPLEHDVPFSFDVKTRDLFTLKLVFQNQQEDLEGGRTTRRGLKILGIKLIHGKN